MIWKESVISQSFPHPHSYTYSTSCLYPPFSNSVPVPDLVWQFSVSRLWHPTDAVDVYCRTTRLGRMVAANVHSVCRELRKRSSLHRSRMVCSSTISPCGRGPSGLGSREGQCSTKRSIQVGRRKWSFSNQYFVVHCHKTRCR